MTARVVPAAAPVPVVLLARELEPSPKGVNVTALPLQGSEALSSVPPPGAGACDFPCLDLPLLGRPKPSERRS